MRTAEQCLSDLRVGLTGPRLGARARSWHVCDNTPSYREMIAPVPTALDNGQAKEQLVRKPQWSKRAWKIGWVLAWPPLFVAAGWGAATIDEGITSGLPP
jgi:hypothetical protein